MHVQMSEEASREHNSVNGEAPDDLFSVEVPFDSSKLVRAEDLSSVLPALKEVNCQPGPRTLVINTVKVARGEVSHAQVLILDAAEPPRLSCPVNNLFPSAPEGTRLTLTKRFSEFQFQPNQTASDWLDAGKLELQVKSFVFMSLIVVLTINIVAVLVSVEWSEVKFHPGVAKTSQGVGCFSVRCATPSVA